MTPKDIEKYYKTGYNFHQKTGMSQMTYSNWRKWGYVPIASQIKIQQLTKGILKASLEYIAEPEPEEKT